MPPHHTAHSLPSFPVYSCAFLSAEKFVLGGGGGASRSGIKNKLRLYTVHDKRTIELNDEFELDKGEDAPMSMAAHSEGKTIICGVNSDQEKLDKGENQNCRVFGVQNDKIRLISTKSTLTLSGGKDADDYQKVTTLSNGGILAVAGSHDLTLLSFPSLTPIAESIHTEREIYDVSFTPTSLIIATTHDLLIYTLPDSHISTSSISTTSNSKASPRKRKKTKTWKATIHALVLEKKVGVTVASTGEGSTFRAIRCHPLDDSIAYTAINASAPRSKKSRTSRQSYVVKWNTKTWVVEKSRKVGDRGITCFDISADGRFLAFGSSDLSISVFDSRIMSPLMTILKAFEFPPTFVKFNPTTSLLISGSADNSIRIISIPKEVAGPSRRYLFSILALLILLLAIVVAYYNFLQMKV